MKCFPLPLLALLIALPAFAQDSAPPPTQRDLMGVQDLNTQLAFIAADRNRINEVLKHAAAVVRARYMQIAHPAISLGRLLRVPFCDGPTGQGVLTPGQMGGSGVVSIGQGSFPNFTNCGFVFETFDPEEKAAREGKVVREETAPFDLANQTALYADIRVKIGFDSDMGRQPPSSLRAASQPVTRLNIELTSEPYVFQAIPNIPPPLTFLSQAELDALDDQRGVTADHPLTSSQAFPDRMAAAKRVIRAHDGGVVQINSVVEERFQANIGFDPCGEAPLLKAAFMGGMTSVLEDHCYTYSARPVRGNESLDPRYRGQLRIRFQRNPQTNKVIGIRAYSFGSNF